MAEDVEETAVAVDTEDGVAETPPERVDAAEPLIDDAAAPEGEDGDGTSDGKDDDDDEGPPPLDAAEAVPMMTQGESQGTLACSVCLEPVAISGPHQVSALACGHCFGHSCIHTWLERKKRGNGGRCPQCNKKAVTKDIRKLFVPDFRSFVDTEELDEAREALAKERAGRTRGTTEGVRAGEGRRHRARQERRRRQRQWSQRRRTQDAGRRRGGVGVPTTIRRRR
jgi:E3 ubiquitin-protein ligase RFWD3